MHEEKPKSKPVFGPVKAIFDPLMKDIAKAVSSSIKLHLLHTEDISYSGASIDIAILADYFKNIPWRPVKNGRISYGRSKPKSRPQGRFAEYAPPEMNGKYYDFIKFRTSIIMFVLETLQSVEHGAMHVSMQLMCRKNEKDIRNLERFIEVAEKRSKKRWANAPSDDFSIYASSRGMGHFISMTRPKRSFNDVFIPDKEQKMLEDGINNFIRNKKWYTDHCIPYHFGILLHGEPGTGKSSVVQAITASCKSDVVYVKASDVKYAFGDYSQVWQMNGRDDRIKFIIVEDIDTSGFTEDRVSIETDKETSIVSGKEILGSVLNYMDGYGSLENVIYIFTTNHVDHLDPALIRPGRIDLSIEIKHVSDETMNKFLKFHYGKGLPEEKHVKPDMTFARIQILVMGGMSFDDLIEEVTA